MYSGSQKRHVFRYRKPAPLLPARDRPKARYYPYIAGSRLPGPDSGARVCHLANFKISCLLSLCQTYECITRQRVSLIKLLDAHDREMSKFETLRWILFIPASFAGFCLALVVMIAVQTFLDARCPAEYVVMGDAEYCISPDWVNTVMTSVAGALAAFLVVFFGSIVAPGQGRAKQRRGPGARR